MYQEAQVKKPKTHPLIKSFVATERAYDDIAKRRHLARTYLETKIEKTLKRAWADVKTSSPPVAQDLDWEIAQINEREGRVAVTLCGKGVNPENPELRPVCKTFAAEATRQLVRLGPVSLHLCL